MFDFIPIASYTTIYFNLLMIFMLITLLHSYTASFGEQSIIRFSKTAGYFLLVFVVFYMGTRPVSATHFADMAAYSDLFKRIQRGGEYIIQKDFVFNYFLTFCTRFMSDRSFFFICALLYVLPCYFFAKKYCGSYWYYVFFMMVGSFMFWPYGTNGIRNGLAASFFLLGLVCYHNKWFLYILLIIAAGIHNSLIITVIAFVAAIWVKNPITLLLIWLASIPLSLAGGTNWESFFGSIGFAEDRTAGYLSGGEEFKDQFSQTGFRWDFLIYSAVPVFSGWYFIVKKHITDRFYIHLWGTYIIANSFWILVIRANFSNRFAYLSWFLMAAVIAYPLLRYRIWDDQYKVIGIVLASYYLFTYYMNF